MTPLLPEPDADTAFFWEGTARHELLIMRCRTCRTWIHYPKPVCWSCRSTDIAPEPVGGRGSVWTYTITHQDVPGYTAPFVVAIIELDEQPGLRLVSNLIDIDPDDVQIGMPVEVTFTSVADVTLPVFRRRSGA